MTDVRWYGYSHEEIYDIVNTGPGHAASAQAQALWPQVQQRLAAIDENLAAVTARIGGAWEGAAAEETQRGLTPLGDWAAQAVRSAQRIADTVDKQAQYVADMRNGVPPPGAPISAQAPISLNDPGLDPFFQADWAAADARRTQLAEQAMHAVNTYTGNSTTNKPHIYAMATPPTVTADAAPVPLASVGGGVGDYGVGSAVPVDVAGGAGGGSPVGGSGAGGSGPSGAGLGARIDPAAIAPVGAATAAPGAGPVAPVAGIAPTGAGGGAVATGSGIGSSPAGAAGGLRPGTAGGGPVGTVTAAGRPGVPGGNGSSPVGATGRAGGSSVPGSTATGPGGPAAFRPVVPRVPDRVPAPTTWRTDPTIVGSRGSATGGPAGHWGDPGAVRPGAGAPGGDTTGARTSAPPPGPVRATAPGEGTHGPGGRGTGQPGMMPMGAGAGSGGDRAHRRPNYLIDDSDAFADDRWFTEAVITPDNGPPVR